MDFGFWRGGRNCRIVDFRDFWEFRNLTDSTIFRVFIEKVGFWPKRVKIGGVQKRSFFGVLGYFRV